MAAISTMVALGVGAAGLGSAAMGASAANKAAKQQSKQANNAIAEQRRQFDTMLQYLGPQYTDARLASSYYMTALGLYPDTNYRPPSAMPVTNPQTGPAPKPKPASPFGNGAIGNAANEAMDQPAPVSQVGQVQNPDGSTAPAPYTPGKTQADIISMVQQGPGYQTQLQAGIDAIDSAAAGTGGLMSGRRMMALESEGQKTFGQFYNGYLDRLGGLAGQAGPIAGAIGQGAQNMGNQIAGLMTNKGNAQAQGTMNAASSWQQGISDAAGAAGWAYGQRPMTKMGTG